MRLSSQFMTLISYIHFEPSQQELHGSFCNSQQGDFQKKVVVQSDNHCGSLMPLIYAIRGLKKNWGATSAAVCVGLVANYIRSLGWGG